MTSGKRNYLLLSLFDFLYLFARSSTMAFFVIWTTQHLGISATKTGLLYSVNAFIALLMQPFFGFISDKFGLKNGLSGCWSPCSCRWAPSLSTFTRRCWCTTFGLAPCWEGSIWGSSLTPAAE